MDTIAIILVFIGIYYLVNSCVLENFTIKNIDVIDTSRDCYYNTNNDLRCYPHWYRPWYHYDELRNTRKANYLVFGDALLLRGFEERDDPDANELFRRFY